MFNPLSHLKLTRESSAKAGLSQTSSKSIFSLAYIITVNRFKPLVARSSNGTVTNLPLDQKIHFVATKFYKSSSVKSRAGCYCKFTLPRDMSAPMLSGISKLHCIEPLDQRLQ